MTEYLAGHPRLLQALIVAMIVASIVVSLILLAAGHRLGATHYYEGPQH